MADYTAEREMRLAYLTAVGQFFSQSAQLVAGMPAAMPYIIRIILWVTASFRGSDDIETVLDEAATAAANLPATPPEEGGKQKPDPVAENQAKAQSQIAIDNNQARNDLMLVKAEGVKDIMTQQEPQNDSKV